jgi:hypothetical protein
MIRNFYCTSSGRCAEIPTLEVFEKNEEEIIDFILNETELDSQIKDYYEAWLVDGWFLNLLEKKGELIIDYKAQEQ